MINPKLKDIATQKLLTSWGISPDMLEGSIDDLVEELVEKLTKWDTAYAEGYPIVDDSVYDTLRGIVAKLSPKHSYFDTLYSNDIEELSPDLDKYMYVKKMLSINTVRSFKDLMEFEGIVKDLGGAKCNISAKLNGHGVRVVFNNGDVVRATTRGRSKLGRDITYHMSKIIGHVEGLEGYSLLELRGEIVLSKHAFAKAKQFNPTLKSVFTAVSSLIKPSATDAELSLLDFVGYFVLSDEVELDSISDMLYFIQNLGIKTPWFLGNGLGLSGHTPDGEEESFSLGSGDSNFEDEINEVLDYAQEELKGYPYDTDGLVLSIDDLSIFNTLGNASTHALGNVALKMGSWKQSVYSSTILNIKLTPGKSKKTPVAVIDPVRADNGSTVRNVPLYNLATLVLLDAYEGNTIFFKYGGESGVIPCTSTGEGVLSIPDSNNTDKPYDYMDNDDEYFEEVDNEDYYDSEDDDSDEYMDDEDGSEEIMDTDEYEDDDEDADWDY